MSRRVREVPRCFESGSGSAGPVRRVQQVSCIALEIGDLQSLSTLTYSELSRGLSLEQIEEQIRGDQKPY